MSAHSLPNGDIDNSELEMRGLDRGTQSMPPAMMMNNNDDDAEIAMPGLNRNEHSLPSVEEMRVDQGGKSQDFAEDGTPTRRAGGAKTVLLLSLLVMVVLGAIIAVSVVATRNDVGDPVALEGGDVGPPTKYEPEGTGSSGGAGNTKNPAMDIDDAPASTATTTVLPTTAAPATTTSSTAAPTANQVAARRSSIQTWLIDQGVSNAVELEEAGSHQNKALEFIAVDDTMQLPVPVGTPDASDDNYEFLSRYVMTVLFFHTKGPSWTFDLNFLKGHTHCGWYSVLQYLDLSTEFRGVACDQTTGRVFALFMNQNNLEGKVPRELGLLTTLEVVDFDLNLLRGVIPGTFQKLTKLDNLFLSGNRLDGPLPYWIGKMSLLRNLNLSHNLMEGELPTELTDLPQLEGLALDNNLFHGALNGVFNGDTMQGMKAMTQFYMENNQFTGSLDENFLKGMDQLAFLDISDNQVTGAIPTHLFEFPLVEVLDLHDNDFTALPTAFPENTQLSFLALQKNKFANMAIPSSIGNLKRLNHLDVSQNEFTGLIPSSIGVGLTNLTYLFLAENDFASEVIPTWIENITPLEELSLKSTNRIGLIPDWLGNLTKLVLLDLDNNALVGTIPSSLGALEDLHVLLLNRNNLTSTIPASFKDLQSLKLIFLDANDNITGSLGDTFCNNPNFIQKPVIVAECSLCDPFADCCAMCCQNGEECNDGVHVPDLDPIWQLGYQRVFFTFRREDYFMKEQNDEDGGN